MSFSMANIVAHSEQVPSAARAALKAAAGLPPARRTQLLESAARILHQEAGIGCGDARELVDLQPGNCG